MARTVLKIQDALLAEIKQKAVKERRTVEAIANDLLRLGLNVSNGKKFKLRLSGLKGHLQPGVDVCNRKTLHDLLDRSGIHAGR